jgi:hypothetical protein
MALPSSITLARICPSDNKTRLTPLEDILEGTINESIH